VSLYGVLEMTAICTNLCLTPFTPFLNSRIDNVLVWIAPKLNQPLFQFINAMDVCLSVCLVNTLLHGRTYLVDQLG